MSGWRALSKKSGERRCVSRRLLRVSTDADATVTVPLTRPSGPDGADPERLARLDLTVLG